jgi:hypothetical protein
VAQQQLYLLKLSTGSATTSRTCDEGHEARCREHRPQPPGGSAGDRSNGAMQVLKDNNAVCVTAHKK